MKALVLDFDGVLADSAPECFELALRTYRALVPDSPLTGRDRARLYADFLALMPLGNRAEDFGVVLAALDEDVPIPDQRAYDGFRETRPMAWRDAFHRRYYGEREAFSRADPATWSALTPPYPAFLALLRRRAGDLRLAIATARDRTSLLQLLAGWGARELFPDALICDKETGKNKEAHLRHLQRQLGLPFSALTFVDDKLNHLASVSPLGVRCGLAAWGYNGPREQGQARALGYLVCQLEDAERLLFGA